MKIKGLFLIGLCMTLLLLVSCQSATNSSSSGTGDGKEITRLIDGQSESRPDGLRNVLHGRGKNTATPEAQQTQEAATPTATPLSILTSTPTPFPTPTALPIPTEPAATPTSPVTVSYAEIFPGGSEMSRNRPLDLAVKTEFSNSVSVMLLLSGFFVCQGQDIPAEATCGQTPEGSQAGWLPAPSLYGPGDHSLTDWGHIPVESIPADATHLTVIFTLSGQSDGAIEYCIQKTYLLTDEPSVPPPTDDPSAIKIMSVAFWPDTATVDRYSTFGFGARLDFESIVMTQVRLLAFFTYQGQDIPGEAACMSGKMPGQSGGTFWSTGSSTRMSTGINHFEQPYTYSAAAPDDATHLVMWLMLEGVSGQPILCWQKVIELSPVSQ